MFNKNLIPLHRPSCQTAVAVFFRCQLTHAKHGQLILASRPLACSSMVDRGTERLQGGGGQGSRASLSCSPLLWAGTGQEGTLRLGALAGPRQARLVLQVGLNPHSQASTRANPVLQSGKKKIQENSKCYQRPTG